MKILHTTLPVQFNFFGKPKEFEAQSFDAKLAEFRKEAYEDITGNHISPRTSCLVDGRASCLANDVIDAIRTLLQNIWNTPEKLVFVRLPNIHVFLEVDNNYTAYSVKIYLHAYMMEQFEESKSSNFDEVLQAEKDEVIKKYGFTEIPLKKYRVKFAKHEAILNELQIVDIQKEYPTFYFDFEEVK